MLKCPVSPIIKRGQIDNVAPPTKTFNLSLIQRYGALSHNPFPASAYSPLKQIKERLSCFVRVDGIFAGASASIWRDPLAGHLESA